MSKITKADTTPPTSDSASDSPPARKRATKKAAASPSDLETVAPVKKAAAKKVSAVKKVAAESVVKKVATKRVAKNAASPDSSSPELPFTTSLKENHPPLTEEAPRAARATRTKKAVVSVEAAPPESPAPVPDPSAPPRRIGRVPGGGPRVPREEAPVSQESTPFPTPAAPPNRENDGPRDHERQDRPPFEGQAREDGQPSRESRSKRRRDKRKRRNMERQGQPQPGNPPRPQGGGQPYPPKGQNPNRHRNEGRGPQAPTQEMEDRRPVQLTGPMIEANGMLELAPKGFGFLRVPKKNFEQARDDVFVTPETIRKYNLRLGQWIHGTYQEGPRGPQLVEISKVNDLTPEEASKLPHFDELKAINPSKRISFETTPERFTTRVVDIMAPVGRGQRGLIVSPPRSGKTTLLLHMAEAIREKYEESIHLMVVLVDERPEEVTEFRRALPGAEIYASSNDEQARNHTRIAEMAIERAKRLVEAGRDVFLIMDSITRLARAYNGNMNNRGRGTGSGGLTIGSLEVPRRLFAAARNTRGGGSLTILATALIQTNSRADEAIYMEFKGTGNMELVLDRKIAENYIYPAVDIFKSGTRREEILLADHMLHKIHLIRRGLSGHRPAEAMERLLFFLKKFPNNPQMLLEIKG
jgi:transcription termination factor Rho